jgi:hypothetical protein
MHSSLDKLILRESSLPFVVVIGLEGDPSYPERMLCILLKKQSILLFIQVSLKDSKEIRKNPFSGIMDICPNPTC